MEVTDDDLSQFEAKGAASVPATDQQGYIEHDRIRLWYATYGSPAKESAFSSYRE